MLHRALHAPRRRPLLLGVALATALAVTGATLAAIGPRAASAQPTRDGLRGDGPRGGAYGDGAGRYQLTVVEGGRGWIILDSHTGTFEHWIPAASSRYHVFRCHYGKGCPITEKRSVDRGLDP